MRFFFLVSFSVRKIFSDCSSVGSVMFSLDSVRMSFLASDSFRVGLSEEAIFCSLSGTEAFLLTISSTINFAALFWKETSESTLCSFFVSPEPMISFVKLK